jgi:hypothetical protein
MQGLKNVSLKVWEELITQSRYPIKDARPPARHSPFYKPDALCATRPKMTKIKLVRESHLSMFPLHQTFHFYRIKKQFPSSMNEKPAICWRQFI